MQRVKDAQTKSRKNEVSTQFFLERSHFLLPFLEFYHVLGGSPVRYIFLELNSTFRERKLVLKTSGE